MPKTQENKPPERQVRIEIDDKVADGVYANLAFIASNNSEFIFDFARFLPGNTRGRVISRVILGPITRQGISFVSHRCCRAIREKIRYYYTRTEP